MLSGCSQGLAVDEVYGGYYPANSADSVAPKRVAKAKTKSKAKVADRSLLETPAEPDCGTQKSPDRLQTASAARELTTQSIPDSAGDPNADLAMRIKLEYERECFRLAEQRMRDRVKQLQAAKAGAEPIRRAQ